MHREVGVRCVSGAYRNGEWEVVRAGCWGEGSCKSGWWARWAPDFHF